MRAHLHLLEYYACCLGCTLGMLLYFALIVAPFAANVCQMCTFFSTIQNRELECLCWYMYSSCHKSPEYHYHFLWHLQILPPLIDYYLVTTIAIISCWFYYSYRFYCQTTTRPVTITPAESAHFLLTGLDFLFQRCTSAPVQGLSLHFAKCMLG